MGREERVRAVQERRRSNAAGVHRQKRNPGPSVADWEQLEFDYELGEPPDEPAAELADEVTR